MFPYEFVVRKYKITKQRTLSKILVQLQITAATIPNNAVEQKPHVCVANYLICTSAD